MMAVQKASKSAHRYAIVIGIGLALFPIHNKWLTDITSIEGMATLFLPALGSVVWILATLFFLRDNWGTKDWGDKRIFIPLLIIVGAIGLSGLNAPTLYAKFAPLLMGLCLFSLYLVARKLGRDVFFPLAIGSGIASLGILLYAVYQPGTLTGGFIFGTNYDIAAGYILLGASLFIHKWRWILASLSVIAVLASGSPEAVLALLVLGIMVVWRRDWNRKFVCVVTGIVIIGSVYFALGYGQNLYSYTAQIASGEHTVDFTLREPREPGQDTIPIDVPVSETPISWRLHVIKLAMSNIKPLGNGYNITLFDISFVHNVPLILVQQLGYPGILAGLAWLWITIYCMIKTKWKYTWALILVFALWDHYLFTQCAPLWWLIVGASTASNNIENDLIFRKVVDN